jgi:formylglycine-generating enzyme required for sulfatase activity
MPSGGMAGGGASTAGAGAGGSAATGGAGGGCGTGMLQLVAQDGHAFCLDALELTLENYLTFSDQSPQNAPGTPCSWNHSFAPADTVGAGLPVFTIDWCDAAAYCAWRGARLCSRAEWQSACGGDTGFPYGAAYSPTACNGKDYGLMEPVSPGSIPSCVSANGAFDMSGNVREWVSDCSDADPHGYCVAMGGDFGSPASDLTCGHGDNAHRDFAVAGARCCE